LLTAEGDARSIDNVVYMYMIVSKLG
jgi:hypothetical protein